MDLDGYFRDAFAKGLDEGLLRGQASRERLQVERDRALEAANGHHLFLVDLCRDLADSIDHSTERDWSQGDHLEELLEVQEKVARHLGLEPVAGPDVRCPEPTPLAEFATRSALNAASLDRLEPEMRDRLVAELGTQERLRREIETTRRQSPAGIAESIEELRQAVDLGAELVAAMQRGEAPAQEKLDQLLGLAGLPPESLEELVARMERHSLQSVNVEGDAVDVRIGEAQEVEEVTLSPLGGAVRLGPWPVLGRLDVDHNVFHPAVVASIQETLTAAEAEGARGPHDERVSTEGLEPERPGFAEHGEDPARDGDGFA